MGKAAQFVAAKQRYRTDTNRNLCPSGQTRRSRFRVGLGDGLDRSSRSSDRHGHPLGLGRAAAYRDVIDGSLSAGRQRSDIADERSESGEDTTIDGYNLIAGLKARGGELTRNFGGFRTRGYDGE